jgi:hypothetical protein
MRHRNNFGSSENALEIASLKGRNSNHTVLIGLPEIVDLVERAGNRWLLSVKSRTTLYGSTV